jgi:hypothetical protein
MTIGKEIVDEFGERTAVLIDRSDVLIQMIDERIKEIKDKADKEVKEANDAMWATENHYYNLAVDPSY